MILPKESSVNGAWIDKKGLVVGDVVKIITEPKLEEGQNGQQLVAKVKVKGSTEEPKNLAINKPSRRALVEAYGEETAAWIDKVFTVHIEKVMIGGKRSIALYLLPEGYEVAEDAGGFLVVQKIGAGLPPVSFTGEENINPEDIPF